ncbi:MAG: amino acid adenylation domain-containing protein [Cyanobacteria bacterium J06560_6]
MKQAVQDIYPLSPTQRGLLFHSLHGDSQAGAYIVQVSYTLQGELDCAGFEQAWQQLIQRHTILRTAFVWDNLASPVQVVGQQVTLPIHWQNWQNLSAEKQQEDLSALLANDRAKGFNLSNAPLMRINAVQLAPNCYRILWTHHHILLDGWSLPLLMKEWIALYQSNCDLASNSEISNSEISLSAAPPYRDYIAWLQQQDITLAKQLWKERLAGFTTPTPLGIDKAQKTNKANKEQATEASSQTSNNFSPKNFFRSQAHQLSLELSEQLKSFAMQQRLTLSSLVQGAWAKVLSVYSGESNVLYGLACAGRPHTLPAADRRVGLFINTLPMRVKVDSEREIGPWLQQIQKQQLAQQPYEYTPLVDIQAVSEVPGRSPLFESVVVFENYPLESARGIAGLDLLDVSITEQTHYPLTLFAVAKECLEFKVLYDTQRFSEGAIARLFSHLQTTLLSMVSSPQKNIASINIIPTAEETQLSEYGNGPKVKASGLCAQDAIGRYAAKTPDATAIIFEGDTTSYGQLNARVNQLSHYLQQTGIPAGTPIGLCVERSVDMMVALLAILKIGCAYVPLDPSYPAARLRHAIEDAGIMWVVCHEATTHILNPGEPYQQQINLSQLEKEISLCSTTDFDDKISPITLAYLIYTSGSTGKPKGVPVTHQSLNNLLTAMARRLQIRSTDTLMAVTTLAFDIAALELFLPLISGASLLLASQETARNSHQLIAYLDTYGVDIMQATPATWRLLLSSGWAGQNGLRILCGGEALDVGLAKQLLNCGEDVWNVYGPTETTIWSGALQLNENLLKDGSVPIGRPIDNTQFYVLDEQHRQVPVGIAGELYIGGLGLSSGYWNREDLTAERFVDVELLGFAGSTQPTLYRTGDRVRYREDGTLDYLGRLDYQAKLRGYRIELGEIEAVIASHPQINQAIVVLQGATAENQLLVAYVTLTNTENEGIKRTELISQSLRSHLIPKVPHYMVPSAYQVLPAFPLTPNGKIDRKALPPINRLATTSDNRPKTATESTLAEIWQSILLVETVGIHDSFFEIGGHSLLVVNVQGQIRQKLGVELSMVDLFRYPTLSTLATYINQIGKERGHAEEKNTERTVALAAGKQRLKQRRQQRQTSGEKRKRISGGAAQ